MLGSREVSVNEIWPCVPWAPSHPFHVMPPRITRNSHRPRASDRTMVDTVNHTGLSLSQLDGVATSSRETYENQKAKPLQRSRWKVRKRCTWRQQIWLTRCASEGKQE